MKSQSDSTDYYLQEISNGRLITKAEEKELSKQIQSGNQEALINLIKANLRFVVYIAKRYQGQGLSLNDLINEGNIGLIEAAKGFDANQDSKFISYAVWSIRRSIIRALDEQNRFIRLPQNRLGALNKIEKEISKVEQESERMPTAAELAERLEMTFWEVTKTLELPDRYLSVDAPFSNGEDNCLLDILENEEVPNPDNGLIKESLRKEIKCYLSKLPQRERVVIKHYFGIDDHPWTLEEIGEHYNMTREQVLQIKEKALRKLRSSDQTKELRAYLG